jgi:hypothetical protein
MVAVRESLALDEVIAAAEAVEIPSAQAMADLRRRCARGELSPREYVVQLTGHGLALLAYSTEEAEPAE